MRLMPTIEHVQPGQQGRPPRMQRLPQGTQEAASAGAGTNIDVTTGRANAAAAIPVLRTTSRRESTLDLTDKGIRPCNNPARSSFLRVTLTACSAAAASEFFCSSLAMSATVLFPSQSCQTSAAVRFKQCALSDSLS